MNELTEVEFQKLRETAWRRPLTAEELASMEAYLAAHPGERGEWELEKIVQQGCRELPRPELSSCFTARVLEALEAEDEAEPARAGWREVLEPVRAAISLWLRPVVYGAAVLAVASSGYLYLQWQTRVERAEKLAVLSEVREVPSVEVLQDFEVIRQLDEEAPEVDVELLAALE